MDGDVMDGYTTCKMWFVDASSIFRKRNENNIRTKISMFLTFVSLFVPNYTSLDINFIRYFTF